MKKISDKAVSTAVLFATVLIVSASTVFNTVKDRGSSDTEKTASVQTNEQKDKISDTGASESETSSETSDGASQNISVDGENGYLTYIPVYHDGTEQNLYDLATEDDFIFYLQRPDCKDCQKYGSTVLEKLADSEIPYVVLETSKTPKEVSGFAIESKVAVDIGIKAVPSLILMKDGKAAAKFDEEVGDGSAIEKLIQDTYDLAK